MRELETLCTDLGVTFVAAPASARVRFSVCTLVRNEENYARLLASFEAHGFTRDNTQFIAIDNRETNNLDGYSALRAVLPELDGEYVLFTHDDVELISDGADDLLAVLDDLTRRDPDWMIAGNAGLSRPEPGRWVKNLRHLEDPHGKFLPVAVPTRSQSLDENFLVLRRSRIVLPSVDLRGFHLFATDLCLQAEFLGGTSYVIPFLLRHHSAGSGSEAFERSKAAFRRKYSRYLGSRIVETPAATLAFNTTGEAKLFARGTINTAAALPSRVMRKVQSISKPSSGPGS